MGLSIKNDEVEAMVREVATARKVSMTEAIRLALSRELDRVAAERAARVAARLAIIKHAQDRIAALPVLDDRPPNELLGYGEDGLPT